VRREALIGTKDVCMIITSSGGVTPIDSIVTAATAGQNFDWLFSVV